MTFHTHTVLAIDTSPLVQAVIVVSASIPVVDDRASALGLRKRLPASGVKHMGKRLQASDGTDWFKDSDTLTACPKVSVMAPYCGTIRLPEHAKKAR